MKLAALALILAPVPANAQTPALWSISDEDTTIYLFGTVHALDEGAAWLSGDIAAAYRKADEIVLETAVEDEDAAAMLAAKYARSDRRLRAMLPKPKVKAFEAMLASAKVSKDALDYYDPWFANVVIGTIALTNSPLKRGQSVEAVLRDEAKRDGKPLVSLETIDEQYAAFDKIPVAAQLKQLELTIDDPARVQESTERTVRCWKVGDLECIAEASRRGTGALPEVRDALLVQRNLRWSAWIEERMRRPGRVFVAVGIEHFVGEGDLLGLLTRLGLNAARVGPTPERK